MKQLLSEITRIRTIMNYTGFINESVDPTVVTKIISAGEKTFDDATKRVIRAASSEIGNDVDEMLRVVVDDAIDAETKLKKINYVYSKLIGNPSLSTYATKFVNEFALTIPEAVRGQINIARSSTKNAIEDALKNSRKVDIAATKEEFKTALKNSLNYSDDVPLSFIDDFVEKEAKFIDDLETIVKKTDDFSELIKTLVKNKLSKKIPPQKVDEELYEQMTKYGSDLYEAYMNGTKSIDDIANELARTCGLDKKNFFEQVKKFASPVFDAVGDFTDFIKLTTKKVGKRTLNIKNAIYYMVGTVVAIVGVNAANLIPGSSKVLPGFMTNAKREFLDNYPWAKCFNAKGKFGSIPEDFEYWSRLGAITFGTESPSCDMVSDENKDTNPSKFVVSLTYKPQEGDSDPKLIWAFGDGSEYTTYLPSGKTTKIKDAGGGGGTSVTQRSKGTKESFREYLKTKNFTDENIDNPAYGFFVDENSQTFKFAGVAFEYDSSTKKFTD